MSQLRRSGGEQIPLCPAFHFLQASNDLDEGQPHLGGQSALLSLPFHMLVSLKSHPHRNTQKCLYSCLGHPVAQLS